MNLLFVNACLRLEESRTLKLTRRFLSAYQAAHPDAVITERNLMEQRLEPMYPETLNRREEAMERKELDSPLFEDARQFAAADLIVMAAPFWELTFPAILKIYIENISVNHITFGFDNAGNDVGLCKAKRLLLVTTRGGDFTTPAKEWMEIGGRELRGLCVMYGIPDFQILYAEGLDDIRNDCAARMDEALEQADTLALRF